MEAIRRIPGPNSWTRVPYRTKIHLKCTKSLRHTISESYHSHDENPKRTKTARSFGPRLHEERGALDPPDATECARGRGPRGDLGHGFHRRDAGRGTAGFTGRNGSVGSVGWAMLGGLEKGEKTQWPLGRWRVSGLMWIISNEPIHQNDAFSRNCAWLQA